MPDRGTSKKVTRVSGGGSSSGRAFTPTEENKSKATKFRVIAVVSWVIAIGLEIAAILWFRKAPGITWQLMTFIAADLIFAVVGNFLWKKANRFDPASEKQPVKFFIQNQLGAIIAVIAFLPLIILVLMSKDINGKQKGIIGAVAGVALAIAFGTGIDFNPPSQEQYAEQTERVKELTGVDNVYFTKYGRKYHLYKDCPHINTERTNEIFEAGTVADARGKYSKINGLCKTCEARAAKEKGLNLKEKIEGVIDERDDE
ncbi:MAG: hypothetical protein JW807_03745 [Spirochaetes bacterium]|nr:hypothetical protein [Spirochaetota bacterium]